MARAQRLATFATQVKSSLRKGKRVRGYTRKNRLRRYLTGGAIGTVAGAGLLGGGIFLSRGRGQTLASAGAKAAQKAQKTRKTEEMLLATVGGQGRSAKQLANQQRVAARRQAITEQLQGRRQNPRNTENLSGRAAIKREAEVLRRTGNDLFYRRQRKPKGFTESFSRGGGETVIFTFMQDLDTAEFRKRGAKDKKKRKRPASRRRKTAQREEERPAPTGRAYDSDLDRNLRRTELATRSVRQVASSVNSVANAADSYRRLGQSLGFVPR